MSFFLLQLTHGPRATALAVASLALFAITQAQAKPLSGQGTWQTTLQGRELDGNLENGYEAYYDIDLNITWLADANYAQTSGYTSVANGGVDRYSVYDINVKWINGGMGWNAAKSWAENLNVGGVTGWRLPKMVDVGVSGCASDSARTGVKCNSYVNPKTSEVDHLFYVTLGNKAHYPPLENNPGLLLNNTGPFKNIQVSDYWFDGEYEPYPVYAWFFIPGYGLRGNDGKSGGYYAWAVRSGDVASVEAVAAAVPEPQAYALALAGLALVGVGARRRNR